MIKQRLDLYLVANKFAQSRSQAENLIRLGQVTVNGKVQAKPGFAVSDNQQVNLTSTERYVSRAGLKLASVAKLLNVNFADKVVLDVGSSTGGFTDYAIQNRARKVFAVDVGTEQLHPSLRDHSKIELHEKTDIRNVSTDPAVQNSDVILLDIVPDIVVIDVSFISLREILPHIATITDKHTQVIAMVKPQFEAGRQQVSKGVIKNDSIRRSILKDFESWVKLLFVIIDKRDSEVAGTKGNRERFYVLKKIS